MEEEDRISALPGSLIFHILSYLNMRDVIKTSFLSRAWRHKWKEAICLDFDGDGDSEKELFIDRALLHLESSEIHKLFIKCSNTDTISGSLDSWLRFATRRGVQHVKVTFSFSNVDWGKQQWYQVPHYLFKCSSLKSLDLCLCDLNLPTVVQLSSLKTLILQVIDFPEDAIGFLTSNCPSLEFLSLNICNVTRNLYISISNRSLKTLTIYEGHEAAETDTLMIISAPYLQHLKFRCALPRNSYSIQDLSSLLVLSFKEFFQDSDLINFSEEWQRYGELLGCIGDKCRHLKRLKLCNFFVQVLSMRGVHNLKPMSIHAKCIELETKVTKWDLPGISYILKSAPFIQNLTIYPPGKDEVLIDDFKDKYVFAGKGFWDGEDFDFSSQFRNLTTVKIFIYLSEDKLSDVDAALKTFEET